MRIITLLAFSVAACLISCASRPLNRSENGQKVGKWVYKNKKTNIYSKGKYVKGVEAGVWRYYQGDTLWKREKYRGNISDVKIFYPNKRVSSKGQTQLDITEKDIHWYYIGDWKYYDERGRLTDVRTFENGKPVRDKVYRKQR